MKQRWLARMVSYGLFCIFLTSSAWAGQVVTEEVKSWAKGALEQEKALKTVTAPNTVGVLYFRNQSGQRKLDLLQKGMALMLITDLSKIRDIQVVERVKIQALTEELGLGASGLVDSATSPRVGRLLGAQWLVQGDILKDHPEILGIRSDLLAVPEEEMLGHPKAEGTMADIFRLEKEILFELTGLLKVVLTPEEKEALKAPLATTVGGLFTLVEAVEASDAGSYKKAIKLYQKALKTDPSIGIAQDAVQELSTLGLATTGGISTLTYVGGAALVAGGVAAAAGGGGGGGGGGQGTTTTPTTTSTTTAPTTTTTTTSTTTEQTTTTTSTTTIDPCANNSPPTVSDLQCPPQDEVCISTFSGPGSASVTPVLVCGSACAGERFPIEFKYSDPDGLSNVGLYDLTISGLTARIREIKNVDGSGRFSREYTLDIPGLYQVSVFVVDKCNQMSNQLSCQVKIISCP
ncbi:MAG: CsgG/HfaB family protein [Thermodesulfobacteriota bacterium]|nr:CsgG/HfaB family protein [Thermodesulfobacteriota bacterium]